MDSVFSNPSPLVRRARSKSCTARTSRVDDSNDRTVEPFASTEIFDHIKNINDPEHPYSLEQLDVVKEAGLLVEGSRVKVVFTPTVPSCSMVTLIGLSIRLKLSRVLPKRFKVDTIVYPGSHTSEMSVNKQLNDKERVAAALENPNLVQKVDLCLSGKTAF